MAESFLEEQLKRMKDMSEQMSRVTTELSNELARDRESRRQGPSDEVRDLRTYPDGPGSAPGARQSLPRTRNRPARGDDMERPRRQRGSGGRRPTTSDRRVQRRRAD